jgi:hypothetical protein
MSPWFSWALVSGHLPAYFSNCPEEVLIKLAIVPKISKFSWNTAVHDHWPELTKIANFKYKCNEISTTGKTFYRSFSYFTFVFVFDNLQPRYLKKAWKYCKFFVQNIFLLFWGFFKQIFSCPYLVYTYSFS